MSRNRKQVYVDLRLKKHIVERLMKGFAVHVRKDGQGYALKMVLKPVDPRVARIERLEAELQALKASTVARRKRIVSEETKAIWRANAAKARAAKRAKAGLHA